MLVICGKCFHLTCCFSVALTIPDEFLYFVMVVNQNMENLQQLYDIFCVEAIRAKLFNSMERSAEQQNVLNENNIRGNYSEHFLNSSTSRIDLLWMIIAYQIKSGSTFYQGCFFFHLKFLSSLYFRSICCSSGMECCLK